MKFKSLKTAVLGSILLINSLANVANAGLILTIDSYTTSELKITLSGFFDADSIGDQVQWLAIKNDWSNNYGVHTELFNSMPTVVSDSVALNGVGMSQQVQNGLDEWKDAIFWGSSTGRFLAGDVVSGTIHLTGAAGTFNPTANASLQLLSGFDNGQRDWTRLEASAESNAVPEPSTLAIFALGMIGLASRRFKKQP
jgi:hypothetical protein